MSKNVDDIVQKMIEILNILPIEYRTTGGSFKYPFTSYLIPRTYIQDANLLNRS